MEIILLMTKCFMGIYLVECTQAVTITLLMVQNYEWLSRDLKERSLICMPHIEEMYNDDSETA